jgi:hypothetical protein
MAEEGRLASSSPGFPRPEDARELTGRGRTEAGGGRKVLLNCSIDAVSLTPAYRKPLDLIFTRAKSSEWSRREHLNLRPPGPEPDYSKLARFCEISEFQAL